MSDVVNCNDRKSSYEAIEIAVRRSLSSATDACGCFRTSWLGALVGSEAAMSPYSDAHNAFVNGNGVDKCFRWIDVPGFSLRVIAVS